MGQIQEALRKAKALKTGEDGSTVHRHMVVQPKPELVESPLAKLARQMTLDIDARYSSRIIGASKGQGINSAYKMLRTRLLQQMRTNNWIKLAISSARPSAGKTLTAINTALSCAIEPNQKVILVDLDLRRPTIAKYLGIPRGPGLTDYLKGEVSLDKIVVHPNIERLLIVPNFDSAENSSELLSSARMIDLVSALSHHTNSTIVLFDLPPMLEADDMLAFSPQFDALLMVVAQSETRRIDLKKSFEMLENINLAGVVLNKSRGNEDAPGYY
jgi:capsular exopolysaccharide synthesis family protein